MNRASRKSHRSLKPRISNHRLKPEQGHKNLKAYDRKSMKQKTKELLKASPD